MFSIVPIDLLGDEECGKAHSSNLALKLNATSAPNNSPAMRRLRSNYMFRPSVREPSCSTVKAVSFASTTRGLSEWRSHLLGIFFLGRWAAVFLTAVLDVVTRGITLLSQGVSHLFRSSSSGCRDGG